MSSTEDTPTRHSKPKIAMLTSFCVDDLATVAESLPDQVSYIEVYAFMQKNLRFLFGELPTTVGSRNALWVMSDAYEDPDAPKNTAQKLAEVFDGKTIVSLATFLPELSAHEEFKPAWMAARKALMFLVLLARKLNDYNHQVRTIEFVGGSVVDGVWLGLDGSDEKIYVVNRLQSGEAVDRILRRLLPVAQLAAKEPRISLALELEPGPLFAAGDRYSVLDFCRKVATHESTCIQQVVGVNLDIAHWAFLEGIDNDWISEHPVVLNRIIHAHICDHSKGHINDARPLTFHSELEFQPMLRLLRNLMQRRSTENAPRFSGILTCEMECCESKEVVAETFTTLEELVKRSY